MSGALFCVLVTRPRPQGEALCSYLQTRGYDPLYLPVIDIQPASDEPLLRAQVAALANYDWAIFISRSAVTMSAPIILQQWPTLPQGLKIAAIGEGSGHALKAAALPLDLYPQGEWNSEGLLALPEFENVNAQKIAIFCGKGGREHLAQTLEKRGAEVTRFVAYERALPQVDVGPYLELLQLQKIEAVMATSNEGLFNLIALIGEKELPRLQKIPLVLVSERIMIQAKALGFEKCFLAKTAKHEDIFQALQKIRTVVMTSPDNKEAKTQPRAAVPLHATELAENPRRSSAKFTLLSLMLVLLGALGAFAYYHSFILNQKISTTIANFVRQSQWDQHQITDLQNEILLLQKNAQQQADILSQHSQALEGAQAEAAQAERYLLQAQALVQLANDQLLLTSNVPQALSLFNQAQQSLVKVKGAEHEVLQKALTEDIATLKTLRWINPSELYLSLASLQKQIDNLPLLIVPVQVPEAPAASADDSDQSAWRKGLKRSLEALRQLVVVYHLPSTRVPPFVTPDLRPYLFQNLHALLNQAMWAALHQDNAVYQASLQQASEWLEQYFLQSSPLTRTAMSSLSALQSVSAQPVKDLVLVSPKVFQDYLKAKSVPAKSS